VVYNLFSDQIIKEEVKKYILPKMFYEGKSFGGRLESSGADA